MLYVHLDSINCMFCVLPISSSTIHLLDYSHLTDFSAGLSCFIHETKTGQGNHESSELLVTLLFCRPSVASGISRHGNAKYPSVFPEFLTHPPLFLYVSAFLAFHENQGQLLTPQE